MSEEFSPALGICAIGSFVGGTLAVIGLMLLVPPLTKVAIGFGPPELFALILFGLMMVSSLGSYSLLKGERPISPGLMIMVGVTVAGSLLLTAKKRWMFQKTEGEQQT